MEPGRSETQPTGVDGWASSEIHSQTEKADSPEKVIELYSQWAASYDEEMEQNDLASYKSVTAKARQFWADQASRETDTAKTTKLLDVGCGTGLLGAFFNKEVLIHNLSLSGLDLVPAMLEGAKKTGVYDELVAGNLKMNLPFPENHFDHIVSAGTFMPGAVGPEAIPNIMAVLKPGGTFITTIREQLFKDDESEFRAQFEASNGEILEAEVMEYYGEIKANVLVVQKKTTEH